MIESTENDFDCNENSKPTKLKTDKTQENILVCFRKIANKDEKLVINNGEKLLRNLYENKHSEKGKIELKHALTRLIRGLGASLNTTKQGYYTVLVALINCFDEIKVSDILEIGNKELTTSGGNSKSENADISAGQILLYGAIIRSGLFDTANNDEKKIIVENLVLAGKKRSYLFLLASTFIDQLCNNVDEAYFKLKIFPILSPELSKPWLEQSVDTLYLLFVLNDRFPNVVNKKFIKSVLGVEEIISAKHVKELANVLINMPRLETANHPVYDLLSKSISQKRFVVDFIEESDKLLYKYNYNRHMVFTLILTSIVTNLNDLNLLPSLITTNYIQQTFQYFKTVKGRRKPEQLQQKIYDLFNKIVDVLNNDIDSNIKINILKKLLFNPGTFIFEKITRTKTIQQITKNMTREEIILVADLYKNVILSSEIASNYSKSRFLNNDKIYATQLLVKLLSYNQVKDDFDWKLNQMMFLLELSFVKTNIVNQLSGELTNLIKQSFFKCLTLKQTSFEAFKNILIKLAKKLNDHFKRNDVKCNDEIENCWKKSFGMFEMVEKQVKNNKNEDVSIRLNHIYETMFLFLGFHSFQDNKLTEESLIELENCFKRKNEENDELHYTEVLTDLFLCLLSYNSLLFRNLINMVFPYFTKYLTDGAILQVLFVLNPDNKNILSGKQQKDSEDDSESDNENSDISEDENSESESDDDDDDDLDDETPPNDKLRDALQIVLGNFGDEEINADEMSESEGLKLDEALSVALKHNLPKKKLKKLSHKDKLKMNFRIRTLDLVDLYLENEPSLLICLEMIPILLRLEESAIKDVYQVDLLERVRRTIKKLGGLKRFENVKKIDDEEKLKEFFLMFLDIMEKGERNIYVIKALRESVSSCCLFFLRSSQCLINSPEINQKIKVFVNNTIMEVLGIMIDSFFLNRKSIVSFDLLTSIIQLNYFDLYDLVGKLLGFVYLEDLKLYKKTQAVDLVKEFFKNNRYMISSAPDETFKRSLNGFISTTEAIFEVSIDNNTQLQNYFLMELLQLLISIKKSAIATISCKNLIELIEKYIKKIKTSQIKGLLLTFKRLVNNEIIVDEAKGGNMEIVYDSVEKSKKNLNEKLDDIKNKLSLKRKSQEIVDGDVKKIKLINGEGEKLLHSFHPTTNGVEINDIDDVDLKKKSKTTRRSLKVEKKISPELNKLKAKKRQSSVF